MRQKLKGSHGVSCHRVDMGGTIGDQLVSLQSPKPETARSTSGTWRSSGSLQFGFVGSQSTGPRHSCCPSSEEYERYRKNWYISLNKSGVNAPMKLRSDFRTAVTIMNRLHQESGDERPEPIPVHQYQRWRSSSSSSSTSWQWNENWWSSLFSNML